MLWVRDILARIRILASVPLTYESGSPVPAYFVSRWHDANEKNFSSKLLCPLKLHLHQSSKIKSKKKSQKIVSQGFSYFRIRIRTNNAGSGSGRPCTYGSRSGSESESTTLLISICICSVSALVFLTFFLVIWLCRWFRFAQLAKGKKSRP